MAPRTLRKLQETGEKHLAQPTSQHCRLGEALYQSLERISHALQELMLLDLKEKRREEKYKGASSSSVRLNAEAEMFLER